MTINHHVYDWRYICIIIIIILRSQPSSLATGGSASWTWLLCACAFWFIFPAYSYKHSTPGSVRWMFAAKIDANARGQPSVRWQLPVPRPAHLAKMMTVMSLLFLFLVCLHLGHLRACDAYIDRSGLFPPAPIGVLPLCTPVCSAKGCLPPHLRSVK